MVRTVDRRREDTPGNMSVQVGEPYETAMALYNQLGIDPNDPNHFPINLNDVAAALGAKVYSAQFRDPDISGMVIFDADRVPKGAAPGTNGTIFLKQGEYPLRSRFTLAHELGHVALGHKNGGVITDFYRGRSNGYGDARERDANAFAAELLMPRELFARLWDSGSSEEDLSLAFGVSVTAVAVRAKALRLPNRYEY